METIKIGDTLVVIVTGNAKYPLCTKVIVEDIVYSNFDNDCIVIAPLHDIVGTVCINLSTIKLDDEGNWIYIKNVE